MTPEDLKDPTARSSFIEKKLGSKRKKRRGAGFSMHIEMLAGNTNIRPPCVYNIEGLGGKHSSGPKMKWFADTVTHKFSSKYEQSIKFT